MQTIRKSRVTAKQRFNPNAETQAFHISGTSLPSLVLGHLLTPKNLPLRAGVPLVRLLFLDARGDSCVLRTMAQWLPSLEAHISCAARKAGYSPPTAHPPRTSAMAWLSRAPSMATLLWMIKRSPTQPHKQSFSPRSRFITLSSDRHACLVLW